MTLTKTCPFCGKTSHIAVDEIAFANWLGGTLIQDAFPMSTPAERELIKTGMCVRCQNMIFGEPEEEEEEMDESEWEEDYEDYDPEMGFDPYEGCYTFDC